MKDFGWDADRRIKAGTLKIKKYSPFDVSRSVEAVLAKERGEKHEKKLVAMEITDKGIVVYPDQEAFGLFNEG